MRIDEATALGSFGFWIVGGDSRLHRQLAPLLSPRQWDKLQETAFGDLEISEDDPVLYAKGGEEETD